jgi:hypothetical protein
MPFLRYGCAGQRRVELEGEPPLDALELRWQSAIEAQVDVRAGVHAHGAARARERAEPRWIGRGHQRPDVIRGGEGRRIERAVDQVVGRAVVDEVHEVRAEARILEHHIARLAHEPVAEHQSVLLVGQLGRQRAGAGDHLECGLEQARERMPDGVGQAAQQRHAEGHVVHHLDGRAAGLVHHAHGHLGHDQDAENQHHRAQPLPALQLFRGEGISDQRRHETAEGHRRDGRGIVVGRIDGRGRVEDAEQAVGILVGVDFPHDRAALSVSA